MREINDINFYEFYDLESICALERITKKNLDPKIIFIFGRSFVYGCNLLNIYFNNPKRLTESELLEIPNLIKLFNSIGFNLSIFKMNKFELCKKYNIQYYEIKKN